jgi:biopolymer transport protein ExbD
MRRFSDRQALTTLNEMNITPLLDLAFVLLIIFMITTPLMENSMDVALPTSDAMSRPVEGKDAAQIAIDRDEAIAYDGAPLSLDQLEAALIARRQAEPEVAVVVRAHKELSVQQLMRVMDAVQRAEIRRVGVVTTPEAP